MKAAGKLIDALLTVLLASVLIPIIVTQILDTNMTGVYKTIWSIGAIVAVVAGLYLVLKAMGVGGGR